MAATKNGDDAVSADGADTLSESYGAAAAEIERILAQIDDEKATDVDELAGRVERAAKLVNFCRDRLRSAELRIQTISEDLGAGGSDADRAASDSQTS